MAKVNEHFDAIAQNYDSYKKKNSYYYDTLKDIYKTYIPNKKEVLEVGCGTGEILNYLDPKKGLGIDISKNMVSIAKSKYPHLQFKISKIEQFKSGLQWDYVIMPDVIEHLEDVNLALHSVKKLIKPNGKLIISFANPSWEPILELGEKIGMKMPEGKHHRISTNELKRILERNDLKIVGREWRLIFPIKLFPFYYLNSFFFKIPFIRELGLIEFLVLQISNKK